MFHIPGSERWLQAILRNRLGRIVVSVFTCVATTMLAVLMVPIELRSIDLAGHYVRTDAEVTDTHEFRSSEFFDSPKYSVQYRFTTGGRDYQKVRPFGLAWSDLPKDAYDVATRSGHIDVIYAPADPWNNDLARNAGGLRGWAIAWMTGLVSTATAAWFWIARVARDEVRRLLAAPFKPV